MTKPAETDVRPKLDTSQRMRRPVCIEAIDLEFRSRLHVEDVCLCVADPHLRDCPVIGTLMDFQLFTGRSYSQDMGENCRHLNRGCKNPAVVMKFLHDICETPENAVEFGKKYPMGRTFDLENSRHPAGAPWSPSQNPQPRQTFRNKLLMFTVPSPSGGVLLCSVQIDTTRYFGASVDPAGMGAMAEALYTRVRTGDLSELTAQFCQRSWEAVSCGVLQLTAPPRAPLVSRAGLESGSAHGNCSCSSRGDAAPAECLHGYHGELVSKAASMLQLSCPAGHKLVALRAKDAWSCSHCSLVFSKSTIGVCCKKCGDQSFQLCERCKIMIGLADLKQNLMFFNSRVLPDTTSRRTDERAAPELDHGPEEADISDMQRRVPPLQANVKRVRAPPVARVGLKNKKLTVAAVVAAADTPRTDVPTCQHANADNMHEHKCKPCVFHQARKCLRAEQCTFCHIDELPRKYIRFSKRLRARLTEDSLATAARGTKDDELRVIVKEGDPASVADGSPKEVKA